MHVKLRNRIGRTHQPIELALGRFQRGVRHHVQQADVQFADFLLGRTLGRVHDQAALTQSIKGRERVMRDQWHG